MKNKCAAVYFTIAIVMTISGCSTGSYPEPVIPAAVNRTYEKVDPSPAVTADFYDLSLIIDTENDRLSRRSFQDQHRTCDVPSGL